MSSPIQSFNSEIVAKAAKLSLYSSVAILAVVAAAFVQSMMAMDEPGYDGPVKMMFGCIVVVIVSMRAFVAALKLKSTPASDGLAVQKTLVRLVFWHGIQAVAGFGAFIATGISSFALAGIVGVGVLIFASWTRNNYR